MPLEGSFEFVVETVGRCVLDAVFWFFGVLGTEPEHNPFVTWNNHEKATFPVVFFVPSGAWVLGCHFRCLLNMRYSMIFRFLGVLLCCTAVLGRGFSDRDPLAGVPSGQTVHCAHALVNERVLWLDAGVLWVDERVSKPVGR